MASTAASLIELLQRLRLLTPDQLAELSAAAGKSPTELAKELVRRGWLTPFQGRHILAGKADRLVFGSYVLLDQLGSGGSGHVFKARQQHLNRIVALKVLRSDLMQDADAVGRFHREVEVLSQLTHPAIVRAHDAGTAGNNLFLAMEYVEGIDLERQVKECGPLPAATACAYLRQAAEGLQYAHERGLVHRDIKPSNLLVSAAETTAITTRSAAHAPGRVKILDLGLARLREPIVESRTKNLTVLAGNAVMMGTPDYMAPEQALDFHTADIRADIYSLGCTFHFLLTGRPPFSGSLTMKLARHQQGEIPSVPALAQHPALAAVLDKMLAKRPADRYQAPIDIALALDQAEGKNETETSLDAVTSFDRLRRVPGRGRRYRRILAGVVVLMLPLLAWLFWPASPEAPPPSPPPPRHALQFTGQELVTLPDGLFHASPALTVEMWIKATGEGGVLGYQQKAFPDRPGSYVPVLNVGGDRVLRGQFWDGRVAPPGHAIDKNWHHVALASDGQTHSLYLDGEPVANRPSGALNHLDMVKNQLGAAFTGGWPGGNGNWSHFTGLVGEVRVWHRARGPAEIRRDYRRSWPASLQGLAAWYPLLENSGDQLRDYSGQQRHGQLGSGSAQRKPAWLILPDGDAPPRIWW